MGIGFGSGGGLGALGGPDLGGFLENLLNSTSMTYQSPRFSAQIGDPDRDINELLKQLLQGRNLQEGGGRGRDEVTRPLTTTVGQPPGLQGFSRFNPFGQMGGNRLPQAF